MENQKGITLVALVVTIIVLLILAAVSISLVAGENGILGRATTAVDKTQVAAAKEAVGLKAADYVSEYFQKKYVEHEEVPATAGAYVIDKLTGTVEEYTVTKGANGEITVNGTGITKDSLKGTINSESGAINWD